MGLSATYDNIMKNSVSHKFKITCPECEAEVIVASPEAVIWERCPACRIHMWDMNDVLMAEAVQDPERMTFVRTGLGIQ